MTEQQQAAEAATVEDKEVADQFADADARGAVEEEAPSIEDLASGMGWVPRDKFNGDEKEWKPAHEFIRAGKDIQRNLSRELKEVRSTLDTVAKTSAAVLSERLAEQRNDMAREYQAAVDAGDPDRAWRASQGINEIDRRAHEQIATRPAPAPEALDWTTRNSKVMSDPLAAQRAVQLCEPYARANYSAGQQLQAVEPILRREFPHLFGDGGDGKPPPGVAAPGTRMNGTARKGGTYSDMPKEAKQVADDMVDRGVIKDKEQYARNYFAMQAKGK